MAVNTVLPFLFTWFCVYLCKSTYSFTTRETDIFLKTVVWTEYRALNDETRTKTLSHAFLLAFSSSKAARKAGRCKIPQAALNRQKTRSALLLQREEGREREREGEDEAE